MDRNVVQSQKEGGEEFGVDIVIRQCAAEAWNENPFSQGRPAVSAYECSSQLHTFRSSQQ